jgi:hypothetical protein
MTLEPIVGHADEMLSELKAELLRLPLKQFGTATGFTAKIVFN